MSERFEGHAACLPRTFGQNRRPDCRGVRRRDFPSTWCKVGTKRAASPQIQQIDFRENGAKVIARRQQGRTQTVGDALGTGARRGLMTR